MSKIEKNLPKVGDYFVRELTVYCVTSIWIEKDDLHKLHFEFELEEVEHRAKENTTNA